MLDFRFQISKKQEAYHVIKLFLQIRIQESLIAFSPTPEDIVFSSKFMSNLSRIV